MLVGVPVATLLGFVPVAVVAASLGYVSRVYALIFLLSVGLFLVGFVAWQLGLAGALVLVILEGALRKWAFPQQQDFFYWTKDIVLVGLYLRFFGAKLLWGRRLLPFHPVNRMLAPILLWGLAEAFNPQLPNMAVGLFGLKAHFYYVPLMFVIGEAFEKKEDLVRALVGYALLSIPFSILGIVQFFSPLDSPIVSYLTWEQEAGEAIVAFMGTFPRVSGTFSFLSGHVAYEFVIVLILAGLLNLKQHRVSPALRLFLIVALVLSVTNLFMTGSRWAIFTLAFLLPIFPLVTGRSLTHFMGLVLRAGVGLSVIFVVILNAFPAAFSAFSSRTESTTDTPDRLYNMFVQPFVYAAPSAPWGAGIGSTHQAARFLAPDVPAYSWLFTQEFEDETGRIMIELGPIGFLFFYGMKIALLHSCWSLRRSLKDTDLRVLAMVSLLMQASFFVAPTVFNVTASLYFWCLTGFILLLPRLDSEGASV